jgi:LacI family transcriptional regulator
MEVGANMTMARSQAPTLVDVAREAGVSLKTASRVLNGASNVSEKKTKAIKAAMADLGYRPNELARALKSRKSAAVGMIVPNLSDPFNATAVKAVQEVARANGYVVIITNSGGYGDVERSEVKTLVSRQIDGLVIAPADSGKDTFSDIIPPALKVVTFDQVIQAAHFDSVNITNRISAEEATKHLLDHGFRRVVAIGARPHLYTCAQRVAGYEDAMTQASLEPRVCVIQHESMLTDQWISDEIYGRHGADAILTLNWVCTMLTLRGLNRLGRKVGLDIPFISFDDFELADMMNPGLSAVRQPAELMGREAATLLFERLRGQRGPRRRTVVLPTKLMVRESCGCRPRVFP